MKNQPWPQAFTAILAAQGLSAQEIPGGIIRVDAPSTLAALDSPSRSRPRRPDQLQAGRRLAETIESIVTKGRGARHRRPRTNALVITDTHSHIGQ